MKTYYDILKTHMEAHPPNYGVIDIVCPLCWDHEKTGFVEGVKVGIRLEQELTD